LGTMVDERRGLDSIETVDDAEAALKAFAES
jgi:hypothetical protein